MQQFLSNESVNKERDLLWRDESVEKISHALINGISKYIVDDAEEARSEFSSLFL